MTTPTDFIDEALFPLHANGCNKLSAYPPGTPKELIHSRRCTCGVAQAKAALHKGIEALVLEVLGEDITLEPESVWYAKTKAHGGSHKEYWRLKAIINNENNLRAEQRQRLAALLKKKEGKV